MKIEAYKCDYCKAITESGDVYGIRNESNMLERFDSYPVELKPEKAEIHFCRECYRVNVEMHVKNRMNWRDGEKYDKERESLRRALTREYSFIFRTETVRRFLEAKKPKK